jgi:hypothetical protein
MSTVQLEYTAEELLQTHKIAAPAMAGGVRCHGGYDESGCYVSPRTLNRGPAIRAWQQQHHQQFGTPLVEVALDAWPAHYPNVAQAKFLIRCGVRDPLVATLTRIGTVEGFGAMIRYSAIPDMQKLFDEEINGTALSHLDKGLFEAHARDEAGYEEEAGHKEMWFAARDIAFENPVTDDKTQEMLRRMGFGGAGADPAAIRAAFLQNRVHPDIDPDLELLIHRMARLLLIEISAFHTFAWAEDWLSDIDLVAGERKAAEIVSWIRSDETPHVEYLKTVLSEMRDRTFVGESGRRYAGTGIVGKIWDASLADSLGPRREQNVRWTLHEVELALGNHAKGRDLLEEFHSLQSDPAPIHPQADGWRQPVAETY